VEAAGEPSYPEWVLLRLTNTKTSGSVEHKIPSCPSEPALCPVLALYTYVSLAKKLVIAKYVNHEFSIWLGTTPSTDGGVTSIAGRIPAAGQARWQLQPCWAPSAFFLSGHAVA
jgi:hypothetical protein